MGTYRFTVDIAASPELVWELWTDLDRLGEWTGGVSRVTDVTGSLDQPGTRFVVWFGRMASPTEVLASEPPRHIATRFGNRLLRGENEAWLEPTENGTRLTQEFRTEGRIPAVAARIFASGSWPGSFRGELNAFRRLVEREAQTRRAES